MDVKKTAEFALSEIKKCGADMGECNAVSGKTTELYYESGKISMLRTVYSFAVSVKVICGGRKGSVSLNSCDDESISAAVKSAMEAASHASYDGAEGVAELTENKSFESGPQEPDIAAICDGMIKYLADARRDYPKISFDNVSVSHSYGERVYMNTSGVCQRSASGAYSLDSVFMALEDGVSSSFNYYQITFEDISQPLLELGLGRRLLAETEKQIKTETLPGKFTGDIIITPACLGDFIDFIGSNFLSDMPHIDGTSIWLNSLGKQVAVPEFTLRSLPEDEALFGSRLTGDGYAAKNITVIDSGVLKTFLLSRYGAAKTGGVRAGSYGGSWVIEPGDKSLDELVAGVKNGLLINRFSGGSPGANGDFTGVAKNSFLIRDGKIGAAVSETMISGNLAELLKNITGISREVNSDGASRLPWVRVANITVSGK